MLRLRDVPARRLPGTPAWRKYGAIDFSRYRLAEPFAHGQEVLDAGCGAGYGAQHLIQHGAKRVLAIDAAPDVIRYAATRYRDRGLSFAVMDCRRLSPPSASFDLAVCFGSLEQIQGIDQALSEIRRVLRPGGTFLASVPNGEDLYQEQAMAFDPPTLERVLEPHFPSVEILGQVVNSPAYRRAQERLGERCWRLNHGLDGAFFLPWGLRAALLGLAWRLVFAGNQWLYRRVFDREDFEVGLDEVTFGQGDPWEADALVAVCRR